MSNLNQRLKRIEAIEKRSGRGKQFLIRYEHPDGRFDFPNPENAPIGADPSNPAPEGYEYLTVRGVCPVVSRPDLIADKNGYCNKCSDCERCKLRYQTDGLSRVEVGHA